MFVVVRERIFSIGLRQAYLLARPNAARLSSRTVLFLSAPSEALDEANLHDYFGAEARKSWPVTDYTKVQRLVDQRDNLAMKLEGAEIQLTQNTNQKRLQALRGDTRNYLTGRDPSYWQRASDKLRPRHKLKPVVGERVDTINWSRRSVSELEPKISRAREPHPHGDIESASAIFVEFSTQAAAQTAYQQVPHHLPLQMSPRFIGMRPRDIIWENLSIATSSGIVRTYAATALIAAIILFWSIPVGLIAAISSIDKLTEKFPFLRFINNLPHSLLGVITGLLPSLLLSTVIAYIPAIFSCKSSLGQKILMG